MLGAFVVKDVSAAANQQIGHVFVSGIIGTPKCAAEIS